MPKCGDDTAIVKTAMIDVCGGDTAIRENKKAFVTARYATMYYVGIPPTAMINKYFVVVSMHTQLFIANLYERGVVTIPR